MRWSWIQVVFLLFLFDLGLGSAVKPACYKLKDKEGRQKKIEKFKEECNITIREAIQKEEKNEQEDAVSRKNRLTKDFKLCVMKKNKVINEDNTTNIASMIEFIEVNGVPQVA